jgi:hypothetical protein
VNGQRVGYSIKDEAYTDQEGETHDINERSPGWVVLRALNGGLKHVYAGTVPQAVVAHRRAKNRAARAARRINRG